ncbi:MAG: haloacid dehalogenase type II [Pseudomonadota bacterium]
MAHAAFVFDAYGTLFDVHSAVRKHADAIGPDASLLSEIWRSKQLEYSWVLTLMGKYEEFWSLTTKALDFAFDKVPGADRSARQALLDAYWTLDCYPEVPQVMRALKDKGARLGVLSNGSTDMLNAAVESAGISHLMDDVISVDRVSRFKAVPEVYEMVTTDYRLYPEAVSFQSSNRWDVAAASNFGFRTVWINRTKQPDEYKDYSPALVLEDLNGLPDLE